MKRWTDHSGIKVGPTMEPDELVRVLDSESVL
jgi:hypothetical protein